MFFSGLTCFPRDRILIFETMQNANKKYVKKIQDFFFRIVSFRNRDLKKVLLSVGKLTGNDTQILLSAEEN